MEEKKPPPPAFLIGCVIVSVTMIICTVMLMMKQTDYDKCVAAQKASNAQNGVGSEGDSQAAFACARLGK